MHFPSITRFCQVDRNFKLKRYNSAMLTLAEDEEHLVDALRTLPPGVADHVITWVSQVRKLGSGGNADWSDTWTEEDMADARRASLQTFDEREHGRA